MSQYERFPKAVQLAIDALQQFNQEEQLTVVSTQKQLSSALKEATKDFAELEGKGILGAVDGFLQASISGADFGASLRKLGEDILYTTLRMVILDQLMKMFGGGGGGGVVSAVSPAWAANNSMTGNFLQNAKGNIIDNGQLLRKYASGGVVFSPTLFPMKNGMGLMSEAGTETIMPARRMPNGDLGVQAMVPNTRQEPPQVTVNVENKTSTPVKSEDVRISYDDMRRMVVNVMLQDQASNGPVTRNYRGR
jgi:phage-related minor tail protein